MNICLAVMAVIKNTIEMESLVILIFVEPKKTFDRLSVWVISICFI